MKGRTRVLGQIGRALGLSFVRPQIEALATPGNDGLPASKVRYDLSPGDVREAVFAGILVPLWAGGACKTADT